MNQAEFNRLLIAALRDPAVREALSKSIPLGAMFHAEAKRMLEAMHYERITQADKRRDT